MKIKIKLLLSILTAVFAIFAAFSIFSYTTSRDLLLEKIKDNAQSTLEANVLKLNGILMNVEELAADMAVAVETLSPLNIDSVKLLIQNYLISRTEVYGSAIVFVPGSYSSETELVGPYYHRVKNSLTYTDLADPSYNYVNWDWYKIPYQTSKPFWTPPYRDTGGGNTVMTTYSFPFFRNNEIWGITTVDISLNDLTTIVKNISVGKSGYAFLINDKGNFLSIHSTDWNLDRTTFQVASELEDNSFKFVGKLMTEGKTGFETFFDPISNSDAWIAFAPIPSTGWSLGIVFPENEILAPLNELLRNEILVSIGGFLLIFTLIYFISNGITKPISKLAASVRKISSGNLNESIKLTTSKDEIGELTKSFKDMQDSLVGTLGALREEKGMFQIAFSQMSDGLVILSPAWKVLQFNRSAEMLLSLPAKKDFLEHLKEIYSSSVDWPKIVNLRDKPIYFKLIRSESEQFGELHLDCAITPVYDDKLRLKERIFKVTDITSKDSEEIAKRDFLSLISHKLLTPITLLEGKVLLIKDGLLGEVNEKQRKGIDSMAIQSLKLKSLVESLINYATVEGSSIEKSKEEINPVEFITDVSKSVEKMFATANPHITAMVSNDTPTFQFNKKYLKIILSELIQNGIKFNLSEPPKITIETKEDEGNIIISVNDNGIGIPSEFIDKIFDRFYQIDKYFTGNVEGVGLGLAFVKTIAEAFSLKISIDSQPGKGTTVKVIIPKE